MSMQKICNKCKCKIISSSECFSTTLNYLFTRTHSQEMKTSIEVDISSDNFLVSSQQIKKLAKDVYEKEIDVNLEAGFCSNPYHVKYVFHGL